MERWLDFYYPLFADSREAENFVSACESQAPPANAGKIIMHQAQRLISLADDIPRIRPSREGLQLLFLIMCVESVSKLQDDYEAEGKSRAYVQRFFREFLAPEEQDVLGRGFTDNDSLHHESLGFDRAVDLLYKLRCEVVHEGNYWTFAFHDGRMPMLNVDPNVTSNLRIDQLRDIVARGCIRAAESRL